MLILISLVEKPFLHHILQISEDLLGPSCPPCPCAGIFPSPSPPLQVVLLLCSHCHGNFKKTRPPDIPGEGEVCRSVCVHVRGWNRTSLSFLFSFSGSKHFIAATGKRHSILQVKQEVVGQEPCAPSCRPTQGRGCSAAP